MYDFFCNNWNISQCFKNKRSKLNIFTYYLKGSRIFKNHGRKHNFNSRKIIKSKTKKYNSN